MSWYTLTHGTNALGLAHGRAPLREWLLSPISAVFAFIAAGVLTTIGHQLLIAGGLAVSDALGTLIATPLYLLAGYAIGRYRAAGPRDGTIRRRGAWVEGAGDRHSHRKTSPAHADRITLAGIEIPALDETKHFKILGTTGTGKSTAIREVLRTALERGDRAVIADPDGAYLQHFYDPRRGDEILNPFDPRSVQWDLFAELRAPYDIDQLARALIADSPDASGHEWRAYARTFLSSLLRSAHTSPPRLPGAAPGCAGASPKNRASFASSISSATSPNLPALPKSARSLTGGAGAFPKSDSSDTGLFSAPSSPTPALAAPGLDLAELWRRIAIAPAEELRSLVAGTPAQAFLAPENAKMFGSIRSVATSTLAALEHIAAQRSAPFSIRNWVRPLHPLRAGTSGNEAADTSPSSSPLNICPGAAGSGEMPAAGVLFLPYTAGEIASLRSMVATWLRLAIFEAMSGPEGDRRLWFAIDELDALGAIDGLKDALARLRKFGGRCVLGFQSIGQVSATYGRGESQTIVENCGNTLILRCSASEGGGTAQFASRLIGDREIVRTQRSETASRDGAFLIGTTRSSTTTSLHHSTEPAVLPAEIEQLADLSGYLKLASRPEWLKVQIG
jgi:hypothetical protein